ncbi:NB-ARC domain-containing protein [Phormidium nigroviride]
MIKEQFDRAFDELPPRRREVLLKFLAGETDDAIAQSLYITSNTVRQHIKEICDTFLVDVKNDLPPDKRQHRRPELIALFAQYKPELLPQSPKNDFIYDGNGDSNTETRWVGRETLIKEIIEKLQGNCRILSIVGITGIGKTSLAKQLAKQPQLSQKLPEKEISFFQESPTFQVVADRILGAEANTPQLQGEKNTDNLVNAMVDRLKSQPILLILDMIEVILEPDRKSGHQFKDELFAKFLDRVVLADTMPSRIVLTSQDRPPIMAQGRYPNDRFFEQPLRGLSEAEAIALFRQWDVTVEGEKTQEYLKRIFAVYEGHPLALSAIAGEVRESPYEGNLESYWGDYGYEIEDEENLKSKTDGDPKEDKPTIDIFSRSLQDLVKTRIENTFNRLRDGYPLACKLLCLGATNRQAAERRAWLFLIGEFPQNEQILAWQTLERRFFLNEEKSPNSLQILYRLHPLMRRVALENLSDLNREVQPSTRG